MEFMISSLKPLRALLLALGMGFAMAPAGAAEAGPPRMTLALLKDKLSVARLEGQAAVPDWANAGCGFLSVTRTANELSVVCREAQVPAGVKQEGGWRILRVEGPLDFALVGILASITAPLAKAGVSIFAISTFDTDYVMVKDDKVAAALAALRAAGHTVNAE